MLKKQFSKESCNFKNSFISSCFLFIPEREKELFIFTRSLFFCCVLYAKSFRSDPAARTIATSARLHFISRGPKGDTGPPGQAGIDGMTQYEKWFKNFNFCITEKIA